MHSNAHRYIAIYIHKSEPACVLKLFVSQDVCPSMVLTLICYHSHSIQNVSMYSTHGLQYETAVVFFFFGLSVQNC